MKRQIIRLTEEDLHRIIKESVKKYLNEDGEGISGSGFSGGFSGAGDGASNDSQSGQYALPFGPIQRKDPTLRRKKGKICINHEEDEKNDINKTRKK